MKTTTTYQKQYQPKGGQPTVELGMLYNDLTTIQRQRKKLYLKKPSYRKKVTGFFILKIIGDNRQGAEQVCKTSLGRFDSHWPHFKNASYSLNSKATSVGGVWLKVRALLGGQKLNKMDEFRRTIPRRHKLIKYIEERLGNVEYDNEPIGYCHNEGCTIYAGHMHPWMKKGMLEGIDDIEKALRILRKSIEETTEKAERDENNKEHKE